MADGAAGECIVVTGAAGFVGTRLVHRARSLHPGAQVIGCDLAPTTAKGSGIVFLDVTDTQAVNAFFERHRPSAVAHLAAIAEIDTAATDPHLTWRVNMTGTLNIVEAILKFAPDCRLLFVSSAEVYGRSAFDGHPVTEATPLAPTNTYASSKAAADLMVQEAAGRGLHGTVARPFNHTGPGQASRFAIPSFCRQIAEIEAGLAPPVIRVGMLDGQRDFLDVDDIVDAYLMILAAPPPELDGHALNLCSGISRRIGDVLGQLLALATVEIGVEVVPERVRQRHVPVTVGDASRARALIGWTPTKPFDQTLAETLDFWRRHVRSRARSHGPDDL